MGISQEIHEARVFSSPRDYTETRRMIAEAITRGFVEPIPALRQSRFNPREEWYRDKETGEIYRLLEPGERGGGSWVRIDPEDLINSTETVQ